MSHEHKAPIPPELSDRLKQTTPEDRESLEKVWALLDEGRDSYEVETDVDQAWAAIRDKMPSTDSTRKEREPLRPQRNRNGFLKAGIGALVVMAVMAGMFTWWSSPVEVHVAPGERVLAAIPDGSSVTLTGGSSITYPRGFSRFPGLSTANRQVYLTGEAFFNVLEDTRPFIVETFNARIEVLGTSFEVQTWNDETSVVLSSGEVRVVSKTSSDTSVTLHTPGDRSRIIGEDVAPVPPENTGRVVKELWDRQGFYAPNQPLQTIVNRLEQRYGKEIRVSSATAASRVMTLYYPQAVDLEVILHDISTAGELRYRPTNRGYELLDNVAD